VFAQGQLWRKVRARDERGTAAMIIEIHKPELENLIRERMASGEFQNVEDVLMQALKSSPAGEQQPARPQKPKKSLGQFLLESPLRDSGLKLERQRDYPRPSEL
jgi:hypothetical protein